MEDILEFFATLVTEMFSGAKYKNPRTSTWLLTVWSSVLAVALIWFTVWHAVALFRQESIVGTIVLSVIAFVEFVVALIVIVRGHRKNWERF